MTEHEAKELRETTERVRRIETRVTKLGQALGVDLGGSRPTWVGDHIAIPSRNCSIADILAAVPLARRGTTVRVEVGGEFLMDMRTPA